MQEEEDAGGRGCRKQSGETPRGDGPGGGRGKEAVTSSEARTIHVREEV